ncbi:hypothetical protein [Cupriavidus oxalaticus]|uniref:hypothetical protein n=1 Tax=Cupriavidus oxalaticus TaxID=96344 RepID=UPI003173DC4A
MSDNLKVGFLVLAALAAVIFVSGRVMGMDMSIADMARQLLQLGTDLLHRQML